MPSRLKASHPPLSNSSTSHHRFAHTPRPGPRFFPSRLQRTANEPQSEQEDNDYFGGLSEEISSSSGDEVLLNQNESGSEEEDAQSPDLGSDHFDGSLPRTGSTSNLASGQSPPLSFDIKLKRSESSGPAGRRRSTHRRSTMNVDRPHLVSGTAYANGGENAEYYSSEEENTEDEALFAQEVEERYEWQHMLNNVLSGDVLKNEKTRISSNLSHQGEDRESKRKLLAHYIWLKVRAFLNGRKDLNQEQRFLEEARTHIPPILDLVMTFRVSDDFANEGSAEEQVSHLLRKIEWCESLYPSTRSLGNEISLYAEEEFSMRLDALRSWQSITSRLRVTLGILQRWTGSESLKVTEAGSSVENRETAEAAGIVGKNVAALVDTSSFLDRILKEGGIQEIFKKGTLTSVLVLVRAAKETMVANSRLFKDLNLPTGFTHNLISLVNFTPTLIQETLRRSLEYANRLRDNSVAKIDELLDDFNTTLEYAFETKREFRDIAAPDPTTGWALNIEEASRVEYDNMLLEGVKFYNKLLDMKLKSPDKRIQFQETELVETHWKFLSEKAADLIENGDLYLGEHFASLTARLMNRVIDNFKAQVKSIEQRQDMSPTELVRWFNQMLDNIRSRHRRLLRFARNMLQRFENSSEYNLAEVDLNLFMNALQESNHFFVYTGTFEKNGMYIIGSPSLQENSKLVEQILTKCFSHETQIGLRRQAEVEDEYGVEMGPQEQPHYVLLLTPRERFYWLGTVMNLEIPSTDYDLHDKRVRLVSDGPMARLSRSKNQFLSMFPHFKNKNVVENKAHLSRIAKQLKRIRRSANRLSETIVTGSASVEEALQKSQKPNTYEGVMTSYFTFAADLGTRSVKHMDLKTRSNFNLRLIRLAIQWISFICDGCQPSDPRTFKWAVTALEFAKSTTKGDNIMKLNSQEFSVLRSKVADCMTLLISHFDIMGVRSGYENTRKQEIMDDVLQEAKRQVSERLALINSKEVVRHGRDLEPLSVQRNRFLKALEPLEELRRERGEMSQTVGKVLDYRPEDHSLLLLASSSSNINIRWQQGKFIGEGTFGKVYMAANLDTTEIMAVKEINFRDTTSANSVINQVRDEMTVMSKIKHQNIVEYYGIEVHRDRVYIFMEFCSGGSLGQILDHGRLEDEELIQVYAYQLVAGLEYLHEHNIVHRDIKPENILLDQGGTVKYVDFGAAKVLAKNSKTLAARSRMLNNMNVQARMPGQERGGAMKSLTGTPMYMSPEAIKTSNTGRMGAMDIWSLGCVLLECATGKRPWSNLNFDNEWAILWHIGQTSDHPPLPEQGQLSEEGIDFIRQCLTVDPEKRPTATELLAHPWIGVFRDAMEERYELETLGISSINTLVEDNPEYELEELNTALPARHTMNFRGLTPLEEEEDEDDREGKEQGYTGDEADEVSAADKIDKT